MISSDVIFQVKRELGKLLKETREQRGLELKQVADMTKINKHYLEGIEAGDWSSMPGDFYARGFLRTYAKTVNIDIKDYLEKLDEQDEKAKQNESSWQQKQTDITKAPIAPIKLNAVRSIRFGKIFATTLVVVLLAVFAYVVYQYISNIEQELEQPLLEQPASERPVDELPEKEPDAEAEPATQATVVNKTAGDDTNDYFEISGVNSYSLTITAARQNCWYEVRAGSYNGEIISTNTLRVGDSSVELELDSNTWMRLGNPGGVDVLVNEELLEIVDLKKPRNVHISLK